MRPGTQSRSVCRRPSAADARANSRLLRPTSDGESPAIDSLSSSACPDTSRTTTPPRSETDVDVHQRFGYTSDVRATREIEHRRVQRHGAKAATVRVDGVLDRNRKLELSARR